MELDTKVICLVIVLIVYEFMIKRSKLTFNKWAILGIFTAFSYATISFIEHKDEFIMDRALFIALIIFKTLFFTILYITARRSYYKLPQDMQRQSFYEYCIIAFSLIVLIAITQGPELMNWPFFDQETGNDITIINHQGVATFMEVILVILGVYIFIRNWICLKMAARKNR